MAEKHDTRLIYTAEHIGARLGHMAARLDAWKAQHQEITKELESLKKAATGLLAGVTTRRFQGKRKQSDRLKQAKAAAMKAKTRAGWTNNRDAAHAPVNEQTKPSDTRAVIRATEGKRWTARQRGRG